MEEDTTPKASPIVALPLAQMVKQVSIHSSIPLCDLGSSMHAPGNEMVNNAPAPVPQPKADDLLANTIAILQQMIKASLAPLQKELMCVANLVDG